MIKVPVDASKPSNPKTGKTEPGPTPAGFDPSAVKRLLHMVAEGILDRPDRVSITIAHQTGEVNFTMHVPGGEIDKIIGERGRTVRSLRTFFSALSARHGLRISLEVVEV